MKLYHLAEHWWDYFVYVGCYDSEEKRNQAWERHKEENHLSENDKVMFESELNEDIKECI